MSASGSSRHSLPFSPNIFSGRVLATYVRGEPVYDRGHFSAVPAGRILKRGQE